jgi:DNA repair protein RecN (Recombination protein N)
MLAHLRIRNFVLIDELDLNLSAGFSVLTGETGAGKSLIAAAVDLLLGRRAKGELVRQKSLGAEIEGIFDISDEPAIKARLTGAGLPSSDELLVRRVIPANGRHGCYVNGRLTSLGLLEEMTEGLVHLMSQHEKHSLVEPSRQLEILDGFGGIDADLEEMTNLFRMAKEAQKKLDDLKEQEHDRAGRLDYVSFQIAEIDRVAPKTNELEELEKIVARLRHQEQLASAAASSALTLYEGDGSVYDRLGSVSSELEEVSKYDESLGNCASQIKEAASLVEDAARFLVGYGRDIDADPERLETLEDRLEELKKLVRKHGTDLLGVIALRKKLALEVETLSRYEEAIDEAEKDSAERRAKAVEQAKKLTKKREQTAKRFSKTVTAELKDLEFGNVEFGVLLAPEAKGLGPSGADRVEFVAALNPGEGAHPLRKVASGGELSRLMLAIKRAAAGVGPVGTYVFDEVDSGIGGRVAASIGRKLKEVSGHHQVICITHLPQIAGMAGDHLLVSKGMEKGRTVTRIASLDGDSRIDELARMLGGEKVTKQTKDAARELMAQDD